MNHKMGILSIETSFNYDFSSQGPSIEIDDINPSDMLRNMDRTNAVFLFTEENRVYFNEAAIKHGVAVSVASNMMIVQIANGLEKGAAEPAFEETTELIVPAGGFVVLAMDEDYHGLGLRKFFARHCKVGDLVKLKMNGSSVNLMEALNQSECISYRPHLILESKEMATTYHGKMTLEGSVRGIKPDTDLSLLIRGYEPDHKLRTQMRFAVNSDGGEQSFAYEVELAKGVNYIDVLLLIDACEAEDTKKQLVRYCKAGNAGCNKRMIMWIEQYVNVETLNSTEKIEEMMKKAREARITDLAVDVKGCEGYVSYRKSTLSHTPYLTETTNPLKRCHMEIDLLGELIRIAHYYGIRVLASFNFFAEGVIRTKDYAIKVPTLHPDWAERLYAPEDGGRIQSVLDTNREASILYVNPAEKEVQELQINRVKEVLMNYDVDGIVMDRTRYDHQYADFSQTSRVQFEEYLKIRNKSLGNWPEDIYHFTKDGTMCLGGLYYEWLTFRSSVIQEFSGQLRKQVDLFSKQKGRVIELSAYVGSWYETYYQNGVNWASRSFIYDRRLKFPNSDLYTEEYSQTSYLGNLDFLMIGCYYETADEIGKYMTLGNILSDHEVPIIGGLSLPSLNNSKALGDGLNQVYHYGDGAMLFDLCYTNWEVLKAGYEWL